MSINTNQTKVTICNSALIKLGASPIMSLSDDSKEARLCKEQYDKLKRAMLYEHTWNFAQGRVLLAPLAQKPEWGYDYKYSLPADCLRVIETDIAHDDSPYKIEGIHLLANQENIKLLYVRDIGEEYFTEGFAETLSLKLAIDLSYALADSNTSLRGELKKEYKESLSVNRSYNAQENGWATQTVEDGIYINSRWTGYE